MKFVLFAALSLAAQPWFSGDNAKKIQGRPVATTAPTNGQALVFNTTTGKWEPGSAGGGTSYTPTRTSATVLTLPAIAADSMSVASYVCPSAISAGATFTVSSGTGTVWIALGSDCTVKVRHSIVGSCSAGCTAVASSSGFDASDLPLYEWTVTSGSLAATGTAKLTAYRSQGIAAGAGISFSTSNGVTTISSSGGSVPPIEYATYLYEFDDFYPWNGSSCASNANIGKLGWRSISLGSGGDSPTCSDIVAGHPGILQQRTGSGSGNDAELIFDKFAMAASETFTVRWLVRIPTASSLTLRVGLLNSTSAATINYIEIQKDSGDTNWWGSSADGSTEEPTRIDLGVVDTNWIAFQIRRVDSSTIGFKSASTLAGLVGASEGTVSGNLPSGSLALFPFVSIVTNTAAQRGIQIDFFDVKIEGLTR